MGIEPPKGLLYAIVPPHLKDSPLFRKPTEADKLVDEAEGWRLKEADGSVTYYPPKQPRRHSE